MREAPMRMVLGLILLATSGLPPAFSQAVETGPNFLSFDELVTLSETNQLEPPLKQKLEELLNSPIVNNEASLTGAKPHRPSAKGLGPVLRVALWNIERGL